MASVGVQPASGTGIANVATDAVTRDAVTEQVQIVKVYDATAGSIAGLVVNTDGSLNVNQVGVSAAVKASAVVVGVAAVVLPSGGSALANRRSLLLTNNSSSGTIYVGDAAVTTATGTPIGPQQSVQIDAGPTLALSAIGSGAGLDLRVLEIA